MALNEFPGSQVQGLKVKGIDVNKDHITVNIDWVDAATGNYFDPTTYSVTVTKNGNPYTIEKVMTPLSRADDTTGVWVYEFLTTGMTAGDYLFTFVGSASGINAVTISLTFTAAEIPVEQYFVGALRTRLWDKRASRYLIDDNMRFQWRSGEIYSFLHNSLQRVGQAPPSPMNLTWEQAYSECHDQVLTGGFIEALEAAGILGVHNRFNYSDELTLQVDKSVFFQNAQSLRQQWWQSVLMWKRDYQWHKVRPIGMASGRFPQYYTKILSLSVANAQNMFYG